MSHDNDDEKEDSDCFKTASDRIRESFKAASARARARIGEPPPTDPLYPIYEALVEADITVPPGEIRQTVAALARDYNTLYMQWNEDQQHATDAAVARERAHLLANENQYLRELLEKAMGNLTAIVEGIKPTIIEVPQSRPGPHKFGPSPGPQTDVARVAWAFAYDDGSVDAGTFTAALRNLEDRYGAGVAKRLESFVCMSMLTGRLRDVNLEAHIRRASGSLTRIKLERREDGLFVDPEGEFLFEPGDRLLCVVRQVQAPVRADPDADLG